MSIDIIKRFDRIVDIFVQLQSKRVVKAKELAERFGVSLRTIYRDIKSLEQAGVPIYGEAGSGYSLVDGYRLPPIYFTKEEVMGFVGAEKIMEKFVDRTLAAHFNSAMYKIKAILRLHEKDWAEAIESQIVVRHHHGSHFNKAVPHALSVLFESLAQRKKIRIVYKGLQDIRPQERLLEAVGLSHQHNYWYMHAFCHTRQDYRQFRLDRIEQVQLLTDPFEKEHPPIEHFLQEKEATQLTEIKIAIQKPVAPYLRWEGKYFGLASEEDKGDTVEMTFQSPDIQEEFPRWVTRFADNAQIIYPDTVRQRVVELLQAGLANTLRPAPDHIS